MEFTKDIAAGLAIVFLAESIKQLAKDWPTLSRRAKNNLIIVTWTVLSMILVAATPGIQPIDQVTQENAGKSKHHLSDGRGGQRRVQPSKEIEHS